MKRHARLLFTIAALLAGTNGARAADANMYQLSGTSSTGAPLWQPVGPSNPLSVNATVSVSASIAGFTPAGTYASLTATGSSSASTALPAGTVVAFYNTGSSAVSCVLASGTATATGSKEVIQPGGSAYLTVGANNNAACIDQAGSASNLVVLSGGAGLGANTAGLPPPGSAVSAVSVPVVIASDQGAVATKPGSSASSADALAAVISSAAESGHVLKASAGNLYDAYVTAGATAGFLMVFNATSAPADGAVTPQDCLQVPANTTQSLFTAGTPPESFSTGITAVFSTTGCFTKTASATAFFHGRVK